MVRIQKQDSADHLFFAHLNFFFLCNLKEYLFLFGPHKISMPVTIDLLALCLC